MKRNLSNRIFILMTASSVVAITFLALTATAMAQGGSGQISPSSNKPKPTQAPRRPLPKPVDGSRGFEQFAKRDASARLIAAAATRVIVDPDDHFARGEAHYKAGRDEAAVKELQAAVRLSPDWEDPHYVLALSLTELGKLKEAITEFKQAIAFALKDEPKILSYYNMGNAYADLGDYEEAIEAYRQAIKLNSKLSKPHNNLGLAYAALSRLEEAVAEFKEAVRLKPDYVEAHYNLGVAYVQLGRKQDAEAEKKTLVKLKSELAIKLAALIEK